LRGRFTRNKKIVRGRKTVEFVSNERHRVNILITKCHFRKLNGSRWPHNEVFKLTQIFLARTTRFAGNMTVLIKMKKKLIKIKLLKVLKTVFYNRGLVSIFLFFSYQTRNYFKMSLLFKILNVVDIVLFEHTCISRIFTRFLLLQWKYVFCSRTQLTYSAR
jgi:hypothetical protein